MLKKSIKKDLLILALVFGSAIVLTCSFFLVRNSYNTNTYWVETEGGDGPYQLKTGSRSEENRRKQLAHDLQLDGPFVVLKTTSEVGVILSTPALGRSDEFNQGDVIPKVNY
jgi:hypothetical protein